MKPIVFNNELTNENIIALMQKIYDSINQRSIIYFSGWGNNVQGEKMLVHFINNLAQNNMQAEIVAFGKLYQSAFTIFFKCGLEKKILNTAIGMIELPNEPKGLSAVRKESRQVYTILKNDNDNFIKWLQPLYFNKTQARKIRTRKPLYLDSATLKDITVNYAKLLTEPVI